MLKGFLLGFLLILLTPLSGLAEEKSPWEVKLPFENATIHYSINGMQNGTKVTYIRGYGREIATHQTTKTTIFGMSMVNETLEIITPDWIYDLDLSKKTGMKRANPEQYMIGEFNKLSRDEQKQVRKNAADIGRSVGEGFGGKIEQNVETILGYSCDRSEMMGTVAYTIHGTDIPLRVATDMMGMSMKIEATSVGENKIDDSFFQLPADIEPYLDVQSDAMAREMGRQTIAMLKDPQGAKKFAEEGQMPAMLPDVEMTPEEQKQMEQAMEMLKGMLGPQNQ